MKLEIQATKVLKQTIQLESQYKIICHEGGSRSSKTWSIFQFFFLKAIKGENLTITIVRDKLSWIKSTLLKDFQEMTELYNLPVTPEININRAEQVYYINGSEFSFYGLDYSEKLHGRSQDWFWINETMEVAKKHFDQLEMRTRIGGILDYNPSDDLHWVFDLQKRPDVGVIKSTMLDNPFLPQSIRNKILSYEPTEVNIFNGTADNYMWEVYGKGQKARLQGAIFTNWDIVDKVPDEAKFIGFGQDFGYTNDPTTLIAMYMMDNEIYADQWLYKTNMTNQDIATEYKALGVKPLDSIYADSSEPKSIEEIRRSGFNIKPVSKGVDSIMYGIDLLKQYKIHLTKRSAETEAEFRKYKFMEDKAGRVLNRPVDSFNHCFIGRTKIITNKGLVNIKDIKEGDKVLTRNGYSKVLERFNNGIKDVFTYRIVSSNIEIELVATPDHKVLTDKGWKAISKLQKGNRIYIHRSMLEKSIQNIKMKDITVEEQIGYTESYGKVLTEKYQRDMKYTIKTLDQKITALRTLFLLKRRSIKDYIRKIYQKKGWSGYGIISMRTQDQKQLNGIKAQKVGSGTLNTQKNNGKKENLFKRPVNSVVRNTKPNTEELVGIVIKTVNKKQEHKERVYDLMVENNHEYFANGVLVHNCVDALRYIAMMVLGNKIKFQSFGRREIGI